MSHSLTDQFSLILSQQNPRSETYAVKLVEGILDLSQEVGASDVHFAPQPDRTRLAVFLRIDGVLQHVGIIPELGPNVIARLKVISNLLTYRTDIPQEGRVLNAGESLEMRVSTFPTVHGEKTVVRLFVGSGGFQRLADLNFPPSISREVERLLTRTAGLFLVCGPSGSGKTTTLYAAIREILKAGSELRNVCTLEDPVEALIPGVSQSQVKPEGEFNYHRGLASLLRQDPEVIMVGEVRDPTTANMVFQASMTGHLVLSSFHAGGAADAVSRLSDMGIEPYILRTGLLAILGQRLLRRRCQCAEDATTSCPHCKGTGYQGRIVVAELLKPNLSGIGRSIFDRDDATQIEALAVESGMVPLLEAAQQAIVDGLTTTEELIRIFGITAIDAKASGMSE